jgi:hypothetical protein
MGSLQPVNFRISQRTSDKQGLKYIMKNTIRFAAVAALAVSAFAAQAGGVNFEDNYPSQQATQSNVSRAQVAAQTAQAMAKHAMPVQGDEYVVPASQQGSTLSREQVRKEAAAANAAGQLDFGA